ncbi:unnamed protein product [Caenorhabditis auriculariae]|uniref:Uncharacterized protein n=1 Tax=Caenorhabditis auriculariae TaxID=2777116 RepID=A0A8S1HKU7_9PELO|nr:unnamed protein product [Caenorhabditis auriculariae]
MGSCMCKEARARRKERRPSQILRRRQEAHRRLMLAEDSRSGPDPFHTEIWPRVRTNRGRDEHFPVDIEALIFETLRVIRTLVNNEQEPPRALLQLNMIADNENGWMTVVKCLIESIPHDDSLGPAVISLFLDECPLPSKETVHTVMEKLQLNKQTVVKRAQHPRWYRNACIVLGSLAEKMAGTAAVAMFNKDIQAFLLANICHNMKSRGKTTTENQHQISWLFNNCVHHPLKELEKWLTDPQYKKIIGWLNRSDFCAQWSLDNIFTIDARKIRL